MLHINIFLFKTYVLPFIHVRALTVFFEMRFTRLETFFLRNGFIILSSMAQKLPDVLVNLPCLMLTSHQAFPLENEQEWIGHNLLALRHLILFCFHASMGFCNQLYTRICVWNKEWSQSPVEKYCSQFLRYHHFIEQIDGIRVITEGITQKASSRPKAQVQAFPELQVAEVNNFIWPLTQVEPRNSNHIALTELLKSVYI